MVPVWAPSLQVLQVGEAGGRGGRRVLERDDRLRRRVVAVGEVDDLGAGRGDRDLVDVEVEVLGAGLVGGVERHLHPGDLVGGEAELVGDGVRHGGLEALAVGRVVVDEPRARTPGSRCRRSGFPASVSGRFSVAHASRRRAGPPGWRWRPRRCRSPRPGRRPPAASSEREWPGPGRGRRRRMSANRRAAAPPRGRIVDRQPAAWPPALATRCIGRLPSAAWPSSTRCWSSLRERPASGLELTRRFDRVDRLLLARHPPADLPRAGPDGGRRLGARSSRSRRPGRPDKKVYAVTAGRSRGAGRVAGHAHADGAAAHRARGEDARRVVRRPARRARTSCAPTSPSTRPGSRTTSSSPPATTPTREPLTRPRARRLPGAARRHPRSSSSGSSGSRSTSPPTTPDRRRPRRNPHDHALPAPARAAHARRRSPCATAW